MDTISLAFLTIFTLTIISIIWYFFNLKSSNKEAPLIPPGPKGLPILGYLPFLDINLHQQFTKLAHSYGPIYKLWLGSKLCVVISSPSLVKEVVRDHDTMFANRDPPIAALVATGGVDIVWTPYGTYWREMRKLFVREMMSNSNLEVSYVIRRDEVRKVVKNVYDKVGTRIEVGEMFFVTELTLILNLLWGDTVDDEKHQSIVEFRSAMLKYVDLLGAPNVSDYFPILAKFDVQGIAKEMRTVVSKVDEILDAVIDARIKTMVPDRVVGEKMINGKRKDFLRILLELKEQENRETPINLNQIKAILLDIVVGGTDTTATILEWVMTEILYNPHVMKNVQQEISDVIGTNDVVEESDIPKLRYLDAVVKETFRLHPPLPLLLTRCPSQSCTIGGYTIPKGSTVFLNMWSIYMDPQVWENPFKFKPERFMSEKFDYSGNSFQYLPFGSGRRVCPGILLAQRMVIHLLATLFHSFDWNLPEGENIDRSEKFGIVMRKSTPLFAIPSLRLDNLDMYT